MNYDKQNEYGFFYYKFQKHDTIYKIADKFGNTINEIIYANPNIDVNNLKIGSSIVIPTGNIVKTNIDYNYTELNKNIVSLKTVYPFIEIGEIGKSVLGKKIPYIKIGIGEKEVFYNAAFHANEWITTPILMKYLEEYANAYVNNKKIYKYNAREIYNQTTLYLVPMINPDGVDLLTENIKNNQIAYQKAKKIAKEFSDISFPSGWKANINGVDLKNYQPICKVL